MGIQCQCIFLMHFLPFYKSKKREIKKLFNFQFYFCIPFKRRYALEEAMRVTGGDVKPAGSSSIPRPMPILQNTQNVPRLFYRQSSKFELLDSHSLIGLVLL